MYFVKAAVSGMAGLLAGLALGFALWGQQTAALTEALEKTNGELATTKGWLLDEIDWSDERQGHASATLTKALADLAQARAELARTKQDVGSHGTVRPLHAPELRDAVRHTSDTR
jgi:phage-related minor tail protein